ncbi:MAG: hypothetical protein JXB49_21825 [Bacteroidales bacterium]|nr:hypothetical protein [Bacteroidales bacterium]
MEHIEIISEYREIPKVFKTFVSESFFSHCIICNKHLLHEGSQYLIEKAVKDHFVEFEYAICLDCTEKLRETLSTESRQRVDEYFQSRIDLQQRRQKLLKEKGTNIDEWLSSCIFTGEHVNNIREYQIYAHCDGKDLLFTYMPYMISEKALEEMQGLLSKKTKEELDGFVDRNFGLPPEWKEALKKKDLILV